MLSFIYNKKPKHKDRHIDFVFKKVALKANNHIQNWTVKLTIIKEKVYSVFTFQLTARKKQNILQF